MFMVCLVNKLFLFLSSHQIKTKATIYVILYMETIMAVIKPSIERLTSLTLFVKQE